MAAPLYVQEQIALGIGPQVDIGTVNTDVRDATNLVATGALSNTAYGIYLRDPEDLSKAFERIESDGGTVPGSLSRVSGAFQRVDPTVSFEIDVIGNRDPAATTAGSYDFLPYMLEILQGARIDKINENPGDTEYLFHTDTAKTYKTLKIWRDFVSYTLVGCTFTLDYAFTSGENARCTVNVFANEVIYNNNDTFPTNPPATAYGTQFEAAPILGTAGASLNGDVRGFTDATLSINYPELDFPDCNLAGGRANLIGTPRTVEFSATWYKDGNASSDDFDRLTENLSSTGSPAPQMLFTLGAEEPASLANVIGFQIPAWRVTNTEKVTNEAGVVARTITGYAAIAGSTGTGSAAEQELVITATAN